jgi:DNA-binding transcriptional MerR regulator
MGMKKAYSIGELARRSGQAVRRIRFYSDRGLLPPMLRSASNYRLYTDTDVARLDLIQALRAAGVNIATIQKLLANRQTLKEVLQTRLDILEAEIASKRRTATVLRATLRFPYPTDDDLRRIWTMSSLSNQQMKARIECFIDDISADTSLDDAWRKQVLDMSVPELPDDATPEQLAAWDELATLLADPSFVREVQEGTKTFWTDALDPELYQRVSIEAYNAAAEATNEGLSPKSVEAQAIATKWFEDSARAMGKLADSNLLEWHLAQYDAYAGRLGRYRDLLVILRGSSSPIAADREIWRWLNDALKALPISA